MTLDINIGKVIKNAYRITSTRGLTALRVRIPGGHLETKYLDILKKIADDFGNGTLHMTTRQGFEIPGIDLKRIPEINQRIGPVIQGIEIDTAGIDISEPEAGYPAAGTRNIASCIGGRVCPFANCDTTDLAFKIEKKVYPNNFHVKIAVTGCPNDCIKGHLHDFGIIGLCEPVYDYSRCIGCGACSNNCRAVATGALILKNGKIRRDERRCIGCGECVLQCPTAAWTRNPMKFYKMVIMGRTGKKNPRIARPFLIWVNESVVMDVLTNTYQYIDKYINKSLPKEHVGYIVDRTGYPTFRDFVLDGVKLNPEAKLSQHINWGGYENASYLFIK